MTMTLTRGRQRKRFANKGACLARSPKFRLSTPSARAARNARSCREALRLHRKGSPLPAATVTPTLPWRGGSNPYLQDTERMTPEHPQSPTYLGTYSPPPPYRVTRAAQTW